VYIIKKIRKYYWLVEAFVKRHYKTILIATTGTTILVGLSIFLLQYIPTYKSYTRIGKVGRYTLNTLPPYILEKVSDGLVKQDEEGNYKGALATSWEISNDGKTYTFKIDKTKNWHDQKTLTPEDITYNFKEVTVEFGQETITYTLQEPFSPFLSALTKPLLRQGKVGVGDYKITQIIESGGGLQSLTLSSSKDQLNYKFYPTESSALTAYKLGEIDQVQGISYVPQEVLSEPTNLITPFLEDGKITVLFFNNNDAILNSKSTRQALAYSIPDKSFGKKRATSPISESSWAHNNNVKTYDFDLERAKTLLSIDLPKGTNTKLELKTMLQYLNIAEEIAEAWRSNLGLQVEVKVVAGITNDYQVLLADYAPPLDPDQYSIWHSTQSTNFTHYQNLKVDKLLEDGRRATDKKLRKEIYHDFQRFLLEDSPAVFLFQTTSSTLTRKKVFE